MPLNCEHCEGWIATFVKIVDELALEEGKSLEGTQSNKATYCIGKVGTQWSSINTILSLSCISDINHSLEYNVHKTACNEDRNQEEWLDNHQDAEDGDRSEHTLCCKIGQGWNLQVKHTNILRESR